MRAVVLLAFALAFALASPTASASESRLVVRPSTFEASTGTLVTLSVQLTVEDFWCREPRDFVVHLTATGSNATASPANATLLFPVDAEPHFADTWTSERSFDVTVSAEPGTNGTVDVIASFAPEEGACFAPDGFESATALVTLVVHGAQAPTPTPPPPPPPPPPEPEPQPPTPTPATPTTPPTSAPPEEPQEAVDKLPEDESYIGDYEAPDESYVEVPGVATGLLLATIAAVALASRRK